MAVTYDYSTICIGIPSYLPDGKNRAARLAQVKATLKNITNSLGLPILIIAQNWNNDIEIQPNWIVYNYDKLGITGARIKLQEKFLETSFKYIIMMDDEINFKINSRKDFLNTILEHKSGWSLIGPNIQFAVISRDIYQAIPFPDIDVNRDHIFEDQVYIAMIKCSFDNKKFTIKNSVSYDYAKNATGASGELSTWWDGSSGLMGACLTNTNKYIADYYAKHKKQSYIGGDLGLD